jgi:hypothetical protein
MNLRTSKKKITERIGEPQKIILNEYENLKKDYWNESENLKREY